MHIIRDSCESVFVFFYQRGGHTEAIQTHICEVSSDRSVVHGFLSLVYFMIELMCVKYKVCYGNTYYLIGFT